MEVGRRFFHSDLYTDTARPLIFHETFHDAGTVSLAPLLAKKYNGVVSVLGNSSSHTQIFAFFERYGGPCILHDVRLTQIYFQRLGQEGFLTFAAKLLGRSVSLEESNAWLQDFRPSSLFLERVIERAAPLIVSTAAQQALIKQRYGFDAQVTTCCPAVFFSQDDLCSKETRRKRLGIPSTAFAVSTFGYAAQSNGMYICILAVDLLQSWNIPAELYFIGNTVSEAEEVNRVSKLYGVSDHIHSETNLESKTVYRDFLIASDAAVQLRAYDFGSTSTVLSDCISAGLPCVATADMAASCDAPAYTLIVPDHFSHLHVAEQLATIWESQSDRTAHEEARTAYLEKHNFEYYTKRLAEILGIT